MQSEKKLRSFVGLYNYTNDWDGIFNICNCNGTGEIKAASIWEMTVVAERERGRGSSSRESDTAAAL